MALTSEPPLAAADVVRGSCRLLWLQGWSPLTEVRLADGHRADIMAVGRDGRLLIVEVKVSAADLRGDRKWPHYRDFCDHFAWAVPAMLAPLLDSPAYDPAGSGLILADRHEAIWLREAPAAPLNPARRRAATLAFARTGAERALRAADPGFEGFGRW